MLKSGLTNRSVQSLQLNAGVLLSDYTKGGEIDENNIIGATRGGGSVTITPEIHQVAVDGAPTYTVGLERCDGYTAQLNFTMLEFTAETIKRALGVGVTAANANAATTDDIKITAATKVLTSDYSDVYWVGDLSDGRNVVVKLKNALNLNGLNLTASDKGEGTFALQLTAHYDINDLDTAPFEIIIEGKSE